MKENAPTIKLLFYFVLYHLLFIFLNFTFTETLFELIYMLKIILTQNIMKSKYFVKINVIKTEFIILDGQVYHFGCNLIISYCIISL